MPSERFMRLPAEKKERICTAASEEFLSKTYTQVSINQIIKKAGIPRGSFYQYFEDKKDLFLFLMGTWKETISRRIVDLLIENDGDLFRLLDYLVDYTIDNIDDAKVEIMKNVLSENWIFDLFWNEFLMCPLEPLENGQVEKCLVVMQKYQKCVESEKEYEMVLFFGRSILAELLKYVMMQEQRSVDMETVRMRIHDMVHSLEVHYTAKR